jgi:hypothetical protein
MKFSFDLILPLKGPTSVLRDSPLGPAVAWLQTQVPISAHQFIPATLPRRTIVGFIRIVLFKEIPYVPLIVQVCQPRISFTGAEQILRGIRLAAVDLLISSRETGLIFSSAR